MRTSERPISSVLSDIVNNVQDIVRAELRLAKTEISEQAVKARPGGMWCGAGALLLTFSVLFLLLAGVFALRLVVPDWAAALIVGAVVAALAALCLGVGVQKFKSVRAVPKTAASLKE